MFRVSSDSIAVETGQQQTNAAVSSSQFQRHSRAPKGDSNPFGSCRTDAEFPVRRSRHVPDKEVRGGANKLSVGQNKAPNVINAPERERENFAHQSWRFSTPQRNTNPFLDDFGMPSEDIRGRIRDPAEHGMTMARVRRQPPKVPERRVASELNERTKRANGTSELNERTKRAN